MLKIDQQETIELQYSSSYYLTQVLNSPQSGRPRLPAPGCVDAVYLLQDAYIFSPYRLVSGETDKVGSGGRVG